MIQSKLYSNIQSLEIKNSKDNKLSGADITKEALVEIRNLIKKYNSNYTLDVAYLICTVHDAIDVEVKEDLADQFSKDMAKIMIDCGNKYVTKVRMEVDITITDCWSK